MSRAAWLRAALLCLATHASLTTLAAHAESWAPSLAEALRAPGPVLVLDCGAERPHRELADKVADELSPLRDGERPARAWADDLDRLRWEHANVVLLCDEPAHPATLATTPGLGLRRGDRRLELAGMTARGADAGAVVVLPHPGDAGRWVILLTGTSPAALRRLDRHIRNDIVASVLLLDDEGERLAMLVDDGGRWHTPPGHPYRARDVVEAFERSVQAPGTRLVGQDLEVSFDQATSGLHVQARLEVEPAGDDGRAWLQLSPRAAAVHCGDGDPCIPYDSRDGRLLVHAPVTAGGQVALSYDLLLEGRNPAWFAGATAGYVLPSANAFPRLRGAVDEPFADPAPWTVRFDGAGDVRAVAADDEGRVRSAAASTPWLVWGRHRRFDLGGGRAAYLSERAPDEQVTRAAALLQALAERLEAAVPRELILVASQRDAPWYGDGSLLAPPELLEPRPIGELDGWLLDRLVTEESARLEGPRGPPRPVLGSVHPAGPTVTVRLWRLRGPWWQQVDEGPVDVDGRYSLTARGRGPFLLTAESPGDLPAVHELARVGDEVQLELRPLSEVALVCLRCGTDLAPRRFPMTEAEPGVWRTTVALAEPMRRYGSFPYGFDLGPSEAGTLRALDAGGPLEQFPSFLAPEAFHADAVEFEFRTAETRFWIEVAGGLLAPEGWIPSAP
jgi:hypothetical protein